MTDEHRLRLLHLVERELVGPYDPAEMIAENPQRRYIVGQLSASDDGGLLGLDDESEYDASVLAMSEDSDVLALAREPDPASTESPVDGNEPTEDSASISKARRESLSSMGISFVVMPGTELSYEVTWGEYRREDARYARQPKNALGRILLDKACHLSSQTHDRVTVKWIARELKGRLIVSIFALNTSDSKVRDGTERLYQVGIMVRCPDSSPGFLSRSDLTHEDAARDLEANDLLFRKRKEFAIGLHTAVRPCLSADGLSCYELRSTALPHGDSRTTSTREFSVGNKALDMKWLAATSDSKTTCAELRALFAGYSVWADGLRREADDLVPVLRDLGTVQVEAIADRVRRLKDGINLLECDSAAYTAFRFANEVMARVQYRTSDDARKSYEFGASIDNTARAGRWYPFQLAFIVSTLADFVRPDRAERNIVDVLFFPTGGGKTEAYLGLASFVMAYRRLRADPTEGGAGLSTLMRYTLRLLTTQQFFRAATAVCAAETIRRELLFGNLLGAQPFSIGLWIGPMTPQSYETAVIAIKQARLEHFSCARKCQLSQDVASAGILKLGRRDESVNVLPSTECPWCFTLLCVGCLDLDEDAERVIIRCPNPACEFERKGPPFENAPSIDGLPLFIVDSDVYRMCPTIIIATVDKFATLPFRGEAKALFGNVERRCSVCGFLTDSTAHKKQHRSLERSVTALASVDLIIQDELHTITDNLGSIYGLFETVVEYLSTHSTVSPKYVCATATVKAVETQIRHLYGQRRSAVFPPTGLEAGDTFFSSEKESTAAKPGRQYVGIYAPTFSRLSTFVAVLSAILASAWQLEEEVGIDLADPYLTLLGYFNTIRDLGGVKGLLGDDVPPVLKEIAGRNGWNARELTSWQDELTGRISSAEVPERLQTLQTKYVRNAGCDYMAATNMISVGVDVPRLGAMIVDGQPKTTAEYIQATSRVGRRFPGIVFVVYNAMRPRDVSHYEHFYAYHDSFYKFVEAGSITPFSDGAIDRYLSGAFVACYRLSASKSDNDAADSYVTDSKGLNKSIVAAFLERAKPFGEHGLRSAKIALNEVQVKWSSSGPKLKYVVYKSRYNNKSQPASIGLKQQAVLRASDEEPNAAVDALFDAPRSMRNVEAEVPLKVLVDEEG